MERARQILESSNGIFYSTLGEHKRRKVSEECALGQLFSYVLL